MLRYLFNKNLPILDFLWNNFFSSAQDEDNKDQVERIECTDIESGNIMTEYSECTHMYTSQVYNAVTRLSHG